MAGLQPLIDEYMDMPVVTKVYTTSCVLITTAVQMELVTPFHLYFNPWLIGRGQLWRLYTCFCFFGTFGFSFLFNLIFTYRYCRMLEEGSFRRRTADFVMMFAFGAGLMLLSALAVHMVFLGQALTIMLVYVWSRRNPHVRMNFFGLVTFRAPYLPYVLAAFSLLLGNQILVDFMGIAVGHFYYYLEDVFPRQQGGFNVLYTPHFLRRLLDERRRRAAAAADANYDRAAEAVRQDGDEAGAAEQPVAPGGFDWNEDWERVDARDVDEAQAGAAPANDDAGGGEAGGR